MDVKIYKTQELEITASTGTTFHCPNEVHNIIKDVPSFFGIVLLNGKLIEFFYSPLGNDGNIANRRFLEDTEVRLIKT